MPRHVNDIYISTNFFKSLHKLEKKHKKNELKKLKDIIKKLINLESVQNYKPHPMQSDKSVIELHVADNILLCYKYDDDLLCIDLIIYGLSDHDKLNNKIDTVKNSNYKKYSGDTDIDDILTDSLKSKKKKYKDLTIMPNYDVNKGPITTGLGTGGMAAESLEENVMEESSVFETLVEGYTLTEDEVLGDKIITLDDVKAFILSKLSDCNHINVEDNGNIINIDIDSDAIAEFAPTAQDVAAKQLSNFYVKLDEHIDRAGSYNDLTDDYSDVDVISIECSLGDDHCDFEVFPYGNKTENDENLASLYGDYLIYFKDEYIENTLSGIEAEYGEGNLVNDIEVESLTESEDNLDAGKVAEEIEHFAMAHQIYPDVQDYNNGPMGSIICSFYLDGDWKHEHLYFERLVEEYCLNKGLVIFKHDEEELGDSPYDWYKAIHTFYIIKAEDEDKFSRMRRAWNGEESLEEGSKEDALAEIRGGKAKKVVVEIDWADADLPSEYTEKDVIKSIRNWGCPETVYVNVLDLSGPGGGWPLVELVGPRKEIEKFLYKNGFFDNDETIDDYIAVEESLNEWEDNGYGQRVTVVIEDKFRDDFDEVYKEIIKACGRPDGEGDGYDPDEYVLDYEFRNLDAAEEFAYNRVPIIDGVDWRDMELDESLDEAYFTHDYACIEDSDVETEKREWYNLLKDLGVKGVTIKNLKAHPNSYDAFEIVFAGPEGELRKIADNLGYEEEDFEDSYTKGKNSEAEKALDELRGLDESMEKIRVADYEDADWSVEAYRDGDDYYFTPKAIKELNKNWADDDSSTKFYKKNGQLRLFSEYDEQDLPVEKVGELYKFPEPWNWVEISLDESLLTENRAKDIVNKNKEAFKAFYSLPDQTKGKYLQQLSNSKDWNEIFEFKDLFGNTHKFYTRDLVYLKDHQPGFFSKLFNTKYNKAYRDLKYKSDSVYNTDRGNDNLMNAASTYELDKALDELINLSTEGKNIYHGDKLVKQFNRWNKEARSLLKNQKHLSNSTKKKIAELKRLDPERYNNLGETLAEDTPSEVKYGYDGGEHDRPWYEQGGVYDNDWKKNDSNYNWAHETDNWEGPSPVAPGPTTDEIKKMNQTSAKAQSAYRNDGGKYEKEYNDAINYKAKPKSKEVYANVKAKVANTDNLYQLVHSDKSVANAFSEYLKWKAADVREDPDKVLALRKAAKSEEMTNKLAQEFGIYLFQRAKGNFMGESLNEGAYIPTNNDIVKYLQNNYKGSFNTTPGYNSGKYDYSEYVLEADDIKNINKIVKELKDKFNANVRKSGKAIRIYEALNISESLNEAEDRVAELGPDYWWDEIDESLNEELDAQYIVRDLDGNHFEFDHFYDADEFASQLEDNFNYIEVWFDGGHEKFDNIEDARQFVSDLEDYSNEIDEALGDLDTPEQKDAAKRAFARQAQKEADAKSHAEYKKHPSKFDIKADK